MSCERDASTREGKNTGEKKQNTGENVERPRQGVDLLHAPLEDVDRVAGLPLLGQAVRHVDRLVHLGLRALVRRPEARGVAVLDLVVVRQLEELLPLLLLPPLRARPLLLLRRPTRAAFCRERKKNAGHDDVGAPSPCASIWACCRDSAFILSCAAAAAAAGDSPSSSESTILSNFE